MSALSIYRSAIQFLLNLLIASFILPGEYGLLVFTTPFIIFISLMTDMGLSSAIVRNPQLTRRQIGAAFSFTLLVGAAFGVILLLGAYPLERFTQMPGLSGVMGGMSLSLVLMIACSVPRALLERELRYSAVASTEAIAVFFSAACAVVLVWLGLGIWSLVIYNILANGIRLLLFIRQARSSLDLNLDLRGLAPLFSFGVWVFATNTLSFLARNGDNVLIGAYLGSGAVGLYGLAYQFMTLPLIAITWPASGVLLATLSREGLQSERSTRLLGGMIGITAAVSVPAMAYMTFGFDYPITTFFSVEWRGILDILRWLAPVGALQSIAAYNGSVLLVAGKPQMHFWYSVANSAALIATFVLALPYGLHLFVMAYALVASIISLLFIKVIIDRGNLGLRAFLLAILPAVVATAAGLVAAFVAASFVSPGLELWLGQTAAFAITMLLVYGLLRRHLLSFLNAVRG